jgi:3-vinyl bacteriochlorophyllide hydratase
MSTYTPEQMERRNKSVWTKVQIITAPIQMLFFFVSTGFVIYTLLTGELFVITNITVVIKIVILYFMCITGMFWEKEVFGHYYFAPQFFWEDFVTTIVMVAHTTYFIAIFLGVNSHDLMILILVAYSTFFLNAIQYILKWWLNREKRVKKAST